MLSLQGRSKQIAYTPNRDIDFLKKKKKKERTKYLKIIKAENTLILSPKDTQYLAQYEKLTLAKTPIENSAFYQ